MLDVGKQLYASYRQNYDDTYSPALRQEGQPLHYWPNITCVDSATATARATESIERLDHPEDMLLWNVWPDILAEMD